MRPQLDYPPEILLYLRSGWVLYRTNSKAQWRLERKRGESGFVVRADVVYGMARDRQIVSNGPDEYVMVEG